jgi:hypothetical protein
LETPRIRRPLDYYLLWLAVIASLALNVYLISVLLQARRQTGEAMIALGGALGGVSAASIDYAVEIRETVPVSMTLRYSEVITVPISYTLPLNTQVLVPLRTPLGTFPINVPVFTTIPIKLTPTVPLSLAVPVSMTIPVAIDVPISVALEDTPLGEALAGVEQYLVDLGETLERSPDLPFGLTPPGATPVPD